MSNPLVALAELVERTRFDDLTPQAVQAAKTFILDTLGVGVAGSTGPKIDALGTAIGGWGDRAEATIWADGCKVPAVSAAIANGYRIHALEFDCVHEPAVVHPMATLFPSLLGNAERRAIAGRPVSGRDLILATTLGVEIAATIGAASKSVMRFFRPATCGGFGVVAGLGSMEQLDVPTLLDAFGILYSQTSGTMQAHVEGSLALGLQVGLNGRAGMTAIDLARAGLSGPHDVLTGPYGYYKLFETEHDIAGWWPKLGTVWQISRISHKPFPSGRLTHAAIDAIQQARRERDFAAEAVESIRCAVPPLAYRLVGRPDIPNPAPNYARLCIPFVVATTLVDRTVKPCAFGAERLVDQRLHALAARVHVREDDNPDVNALWPQHFEIRLDDGWTWARRIDVPIGHPDNPLSREAHLAKFRHCWQLARPALSMDRGERLIDLIDQLDAVDDASSIASLLHAGNVN